ncbi:MAG: hypothetical protein ABIB46_02810 [bacterium]
MNKQIETSKRIKIIAWLIFICALGTIVLQLFLMQPKTILPGEPGYVSPENFLLPSHLSLIDQLSASFIFITPLLFLLSLILMNRQIKTLIGIKIIIGLILVDHLYMLIPSIDSLLSGFPDKNFYNGSSVIENYSGLYNWSMSFVEAIFITPLFLIASFGLWGMKKWGLFVAIIVFSIKFVISIGIQLPWCILFKNDEYFYHIYLAIFMIISIIYFWKKRKCFL